MPVVRISLPAFLIWKSSFITVILGAMYSDLLLVIQWWGTLFLIGAAAYPLTKCLFKNWWDRGYLFAKAVGMATVAYIVYFLGTIELLAFSQITIWISLGTVFVVGTLFTITDRSTDENKKRLDFKQSLKFLSEEAFFFAALLFWSYIKAHEPSIHGLEKFMDYGFTKSILNTNFFPAADMWYAGGTINYYYFGHIVMAVLTKFSGLDLRYTFNLMLASLFAFTATMSFSIGFELIKLKKDSTSKLFPFASGILTSFLVTLGGNLQTIYAFTRGYYGDQAKPFWELWWPLKDFWQSLPTGLNTYWYANATRFIPYTIHEFPSYSFVVSDVHGHVLSLPFVFLALALLISIHGYLHGNLRTLITSFRSNFGWKISRVKNLLNISNFGLQIIFYGFLVAVLLMTNALDGPIYGALFAVVIIALNWSKLHNLDDWKAIISLLALVGAVAVLVSSPFIFHFNSFVSGLAINCPPSFLVNGKIGPFLFEGVEKCQHSPLWMMLLLWGFFLYCGGWLVGPRIISYFRRSGPRAGIHSVLNACLPARQGSRVEPGMTKNGETLLLVFFIFSIALIIFPEFFYFKDIYPMHFRSNTMFKLGYQAFIMFGLVSGYTIVTILAAKDGKKFSLDGLKFPLKKIIFVIFLAPLLFLVSIYPFFSVRSYFGELKAYIGLDGLTWLKNQYPNDYAGIEWLNENAVRHQEQSIPTSPRLRGATMTDNPVIVEADGDSYTDYERMSAFTGLSTVIGWPVHEWLWRGSYDIVSPRREDVGVIYQSQNVDLTAQLLKRYKVKYVVAGTLERERYSGLPNEWKFMRLGKVVFRDGLTVIYEIQ